MKHNHHNNKNGHFQAFSIMEDRNFRTFTHAINPIYVNKYVLKMYYPLPCYKQYKYMISILYNICLNISKLFHFNFNFTLFLLIN